MTLVSKWWLADKVIGAQGLGPLGDRTKRADRQEVPEESTTKNRVTLPISKIGDTLDIYH